VLSGLTGSFVGSPVTHCLKNAYFSHPSHSTSSLATFSLEFHTELNHEQANVKNVDISICCFVVVGERLKNFFEEKLHLQSEASVCVRVFCSTEF